MPAPLILASTSPRRIALMRLAGYDFTAQPPGIDDDASPAGSKHPSDVVVMRSLEKSRAVAALRPDAVVIGADTVIADGDVPIGKPADRADAERIIRALAGREHRVFTGVTVIDGPGRHEAAPRVAESRVRIETSSDERLRAYLDSGLWQGKAGAYGIQDRDGLEIRLVSGELSNVIGLPMELLKEMLGGLVTAPLTVRPAPSADENR